MRSPSASIPTTVSAWRPRGTVRCGPGANYGSEYRILLADGPRALDREPGPAIFERGRKAGPDDRRGSGHH